MSSLAFERLRIPAADLNGENSLPPIADMVNVQQKTGAALEEDDGLFVGYGFVKCPFPYRLQDMYTRELHRREFDCAILENKYLKAVFIPALGGRLWSLYDKEERRELTFSNPVFRPGNLAFRNAWFSGGVEWNCGVVGHSPFTCSQLFTATLKADDGTPVLRMYEFERIRCCTYQMDFFLPDDSRMLLCRMRIVNPNSKVVPMYWWSNIAVPEDKDGRIVVPADQAYTSKDGFIRKVAVPVSDGEDITYPVNSPDAIDYFWKTDDKRRKYVCHLDKDGRGLIQTSTGRLKGRKLFVWGQGSGGANWQRFLSGGGEEGRYVEIQAGLARTQYECLPMPPRTAWEWMEAYGAIRAEPCRIHGKWEDATAEVESKLEDMIGEDSLETLLTDTRKTIALKPADVLVASGSGWGALENLRRSKTGEAPLSAHLDFGSIGCEQEPWAFLLENGYNQDAGQDEIPGSWMYQAEWTKMLEKSALGADRYNWYTYLQLGMIYFVEQKYMKSKEALDRSMTLKPSCWALYGLSNIARMENDDRKSAMLAARASLMKPDDISLAKEAMKQMLNSDMYTEMLNFIGKLADNVKEVGRIKLYEAFAYLRTGDIEKAEELIYQDGGISVPDIREGENSITDIWFEIQQAKAAREGRTFDPDMIQPPQGLDFRMRV